MEHWAPDQDGRAWEAVTSRPRSCPSRNENSRSESRRGGKLSEGVEFPPQRRVGTRRCVSGRVRGDYACKSEDLPHDTAEPAAPGTAYTARRLAKRRESCSQHLTFLSPVIPWLGNDRSPLPGWWQVEHGSLPHALIYAPTKTIVYPATRPREGCFRTISKDVEAESGSIS